MAEEILDSMDEIEASGDAEKTVGIENLKVLENIDVELTVEVGRTEITIRELLRLNEGSVVELDRLAGDPLDILANGTMIAKGEVVMVGEDYRIYVDLFMRTLWMSVVVTVSCLILGFPIAYMLASLPLRHSNLLMILVLLPFWTSLLVRTTSWIVLLQTQGVLNDLMVWSGIIDDAQRIQLIFNAQGTVIAMTQILLPFMVLPLYSVMKTIPPSYLRAAESLGAHRFLAFWRIYVPNTLPGVGAGCLLVFILAIGYYITPALVGGQDGQMISNVIAFHMQKSLNWGLGAALGGILLVGVCMLYWLYNKLVGVDNLKLG